MGVENEKGGKVLVWFSDPWYTLGRYRRAVSTPEAIREVAANSMCVNPEQKSSPQLPVPLWPSRDEQELKIVPALGH